MLCGIDLSDEFIEGKCCECASNRKWLIINKSPIFLRWMTWRMPWSAVHLSLKLERMCEKEWMDHTNMSESCHRNCSLLAFTILIYEKCHIRWTIIKSRNNALFLHILPLLTYQTLCYCKNKQAIVAHTMFQLVCKQHGYFSLSHVNPSITVLQVILYVCNAAQSLF